MRSPCKPPRRMRDVAGGRGVRLLAPAGAITPTGTWSVGARAGDFVYVAGMRGIDPKTGRLLEGDEARVRGAFANMMTIAAAEGATLSDCVRLDGYSTVRARCGPASSSADSANRVSGPMIPSALMP